MKIKYKKPFLFPILTLLFKAKWGECIFTFGDTIYTFRELKNDELVHEQIHIKQHRGSKVFALWFVIKYTISRKVRLQSELEAYKAQYKVNGNLHLMAYCLSSKLYGNLVTFQEAKKLLCE